MWPFHRQDRPAGRQSALPVVLREIGANAPRRFSLALADPGQEAQACEVLAERLGTELTVHPDARLLRIASTFQPGDAAVLRPLNVLDQAGIAVADLELADIVTEITDGALRSIVHDWAVHGNTGPYRRRVERLAGPTLLDRCLAAAGTAQATRDTDAAAWWFAVRCVAFNTPGAEVRLIDEAISSDDRVAEKLVGAAAERVQLARLGGLVIDVPAESIAAALGRRGVVAERAAALTALLPAHLDAVVAAALCNLADRGGDAALTALRALGNAAPTARVRATSEAAISSDDANTRAAGLALLARHWPGDARPVWRRFLESNSAPLRQMAETVMGECGTEEDLPDAASHLAMLLRLRHGMSQSPPRGSAIVNLLIRYRDHPVAREALDDLTARWPRLSDDMRAWVSGQHPQLVPVAAAADDEPSEPPSEELLTWPPPSVQREGSSFMLVFDEEGAHHPVRGRFEEHLDRHPSVEVLDGDREWLSVIIAAADPEALVRTLWSAAGDDSHP
ncbi:hypothetical protein [Microbacterium sp. P5_E9]